MHIWNELTVIIRRRKDNCPMFDIEDSNPCLTTPTFSTVRGHLPDSFPVVSTSLVRRNQIIPQSAALLELELGLGA